MSASQPSSLARRIGGLLVFLGLVAGLHVGTVYGLSSWNVEEVSALRFLNHGAPGGGFGESLQRFRDADATSGTDVLVLGSSHAYRSFDPRLFEAEGVRMFNLGTLSQTPIETDFLMREYVPRLRPRLVIIEVFWRMLSEDGMESLHDLVANYPRSDSLMNLALSLGRPEAVNVVLGRLVRTPDIQALQQKPSRRDVYVKGGFIENKAEAKPRPPAPPNEWEVSAKQLRYLERAIQYGKAQGAEVILMHQPLPKQLVVRNASEIRAALTSTAAKNGTAYIEFPDMDPRAHYMDASHLNAAGAALFTQRVLGVLDERRLLHPSKPAHGSDEGTREHAN